MSSEELTDILTSNGLKNHAKWLPILKDRGIETTNKLDLLTILNIKKFAKETENSCFKTIQLKVELEKAGLKPSYWIRRFLHVEALEIMDCTSYKALEHLAVYKVDVEKFNGMFKRIKLERGSVSFKPESSVGSSFVVITGNPERYESSVNYIPSNLLEVNESATHELKHEDLSPEMTSLNEGSSESPETGETRSSKKSSCKESKQWQEMEESGYIEAAGKTSNDDSVSKNISLDSNHDQNDTPEMKWSNLDECEHPLSNINSDENGNYLSESHKVASPRNNEADNKPSPDKFEHEDLSPEMTSLNEGSSKSLKTGETRSSEKPEKSSCKQLQEMEELEAADNTDSVKQEDENKDSLQHAVSNENISHVSNHDQKDTPDKVTSSDQTHATKSDSQSNGRLDGKLSEMKPVISANECVSDICSNENGNSSSALRKVTSHLEPRKNESGNAENKSSSNKCKFVILPLHKTVL